MCTKNFSSFLNYAISISIASCLIRSEADFPISCITYINVVSSQRMDSLMSIQKWLYMFLKIVEPSAIFYKRLEAS